LIFQRHISGNVAARLLSTLFNFLIVLMVSRSLGPTLKGETTLIITAIFIITFCANLVGGYALVNVIHRNKADTVLAPSYLWSIAVFAFSFIAIKFIRSEIQEYALHVSLLALINSITGAHQVVLMSRSKYHKHNILVFAPVILNFIFLASSFYIFNQKNIHSFFASMYFASSLTLLLSLYFIRNLPDAKRFNFSIQNFKTVISSGIRYQAAELLQLLHLRLYFFLLTSHSENGLYNLGVYSVGISILEAIWIVSRGVATMNYAATVKSPSASFTLKYLRITLLISAVGLLAIFAIPTSWYAYIFGSGFTYVKYSVKYLFPGIGLYCFVLVLGSYMLGIEKYSTMIAIHIVGIAVSSGLCIAWIPEYEMSGAGLAATVSFAIAALLSIIAFISETKVGVAEIIGLKSAV